MASHSAADAFPSDFPYDFTPSAVDSPLGSDDDDEEDFLAALTQRLTHSTTLRDPHKFQAKTVVAGSPQSTLSGFGSWSAWGCVSSDGSPNGPSQGPSPPTTPFGGGENTWDLIHAAAKQVARLKVNTHGDGISQSSSNLVSSIQNTGFYSNTSQVKLNQLETELPIRKPESCFNWGRQVKAETQQIHCPGGDSHLGNGRFVLRPVDFPHHRINPSLPCAPAVPTTFHGGRSAPRKECVGTGVFLPRRQENNPPQPRQSADCGSIALFPGNNVHNLNRSVPQTTMYHRVPPSFEAVMAQRISVLAEQRLSYSRPAERSKSQEFFLPQEWTY